MRVSAYIYVCECWGVNVPCLNLTLINFKNVRMRQCQLIFLVCYYHLVVITLMTYDLSSSAACLVPVWDAEIDMSLVQRAVWNRM